jgi:hypothetical protein
VDDNDDDNRLEGSIFKVVVHEDFMSLIVAEITNYHTFIMENTEVKVKSKLHKWQGITVEGLYVFVALVLLIGHVKNNRLRDCWSKNPLIETPMFGKVISLDGFSLILRLLHFAGNNRQPPGDRLYTIKPVINYFKSKYQSILYPSQNICIDESLLAWKGRLRWKQYIPSKRHSFGIKIFILRDCETGFDLDHTVYTRKETEIEHNGNLGLSGSVVKTLVAPYVGKNHNIFVDNWYTSPDLFEYLHQENTEACGTVKKNRKGMPESPPPPKE